MRKEIIDSGKIIYEVNDKIISLDKSIVDDFEEVVCPVTDIYLAAMIRALGENCTDRILSHKIELDMTNELNEYAI